jgi:hypothetical protein
MLLPTIVSPPLQSTAVPAGAILDEVASLATVTYEIHLQPLRYVQAICEPQTGEASYLTIQDAQLALYGLERYFTSRFARYQIALVDVRAALRWAEETFGSSILLEDVLQTIVTGIELNQYLHRRRSRKGTAP